ncbi:hypothetical protein FACS1894120_3750 [Clostridia bacterium]|nr:hypothetical protein FACS1894120_3750 [Clostridia bacterium]
MIKDLIKLFPALFPSKGDAHGEIVRKIVVLIAAAILLLSLFALFNMAVIDLFAADKYAEKWNKRKADGIYNNKAAVVDLSAYTGGGSDKQGKSGTPRPALAEYADLYEENNDFVGWLEIEKYVNYPVVQTDDNEYYLKHDFYKKKTANGTIFADCEQKITEKNVPANIILYGHNLRTKNMFQPLLKYRDSPKFLTDNAVINFDTLYERGKYKIYAVFQCNTLTEHGAVFDYWNYVNFSGESEFNYFVKEITDRAMFLTGADLKYGDSLLTLSTCDFTMKDMRFVVVARKLREGESETVDPAGFVNHSGVDEHGRLQRKMFEAYYRLRNLRWAGA